ncbi:LysR family transcriptional regulator [Pseudoalteromonas sp. KJ71-7]
MSQTAKDLGLNLSTLSRRIQALETKLTEPLLQRTARGIVLTAKGEQLYTSLADSVLALNNQITALNCASNNSNTFYLLCPQNIIADLLMPALNTFIKDNPSLNFHISPSNANSQLSQQRFDLAIRIGQQQDSSYYQKRLGAIAVKLVSKKDAPQTRLILPYTQAQLPTGMLNKLTELYSDISYCFDITIARKMVEEGNGVGLLPMSEISYITDKQAFDYIELQPAFANRPIYALWHNTRQPSKTASQLITLIQGVIEQTPCLQGDIVKLG